MSGRRACLHSCIGGSSSTLRCVCAWGSGLPTRIAMSALGAFAREDGVTTRANKEVILLQITDRMQAVHFVFVSCL